MVTKVITSNNIDLETLIIDGGKLKVNVDRVVPVAKADKFLKNVSFEGTEFVFTVGSDEGDDPAVRVPANAIVEGLAKQTDLDLTNASLEELKGRVDTIEGETIPNLTSTVEQNTNSIESIQTEITAIKERLDTLEAKRLTPEELVAVITDSSVIEAILTSIKGEEIQDLDDVTKGYLIKA